MAARASGSCVSTSPLRSTVASGSASFGAMTPIPPVRMPGACSASKRCLRSMVRHPSSGCAMLVSRFFVPNAGMRPKPSAADLEARTCDGGAAFLSSGRYHHHLGINVWQSTDAGARDEAAAGLAWFSMEVEKQDLFAAQEEGLRQAGRRSQRRRAAWKPSTPGARGCGSSRSDQIRPIAPVPSFAVSSAAFGGRRRNSPAILTKSFSCTSENGWKPTAVISASSVKRGGSIMWGLISLIYHLSCRSSLVAMRKHHLAA